jgi:pantoate--beta-alanine ligase
MSSRNSYLGANERAVAAQLFNTLLDIKTRVESGEADYAGVEAAARQRLEAAGFAPDYVSIRRASDLAVPASGERVLRVLAAARLGTARLIDNIGITVP